MTTTRKKPFIADKPNHEKTQAELIAELIEKLRYMSAENDCLKHERARCTCRRYRMYLTGRWRPVL